jgi:excisionase family DNA binding protein
MQLCASIFCKPPSWDDVSVSTSVSTCQSDAREHHFVEHSTSSRDSLVFTVTEAAELLGISRAFAYELAARGELPVLRLGRRLVIPKKALLKFVEGTTPDHDMDDELARRPD